MASERTLINLRGYCFYCLKKISSEGGTNNYNSPACTPIPPSPLSTPLRTRCHNVHNLPPEERLAPFTDLCRYLGIELPDCYAFGDGTEPDVLYPPLCEKCHELSARLCILQDELQYIQTRIHNTVERIHRRVASTCDTRGALKRDEFNKEFRRKSKGSLSRGRGETSEMKKVTDLLKAFQMKAFEKDYENRERKKRRATSSNVLFPDNNRNSFAPVPFAPPTDNNEIEVEVIEDEDHVLPEADQDDLSLTVQEFLPPEETLRCARPRTTNVENRHGHFEVEKVQVQREMRRDKPYPDVSTILASYNQSSDESRNPQEDHNDEDRSEYDEKFHLQTTLVVGVTTRSRARVRQSVDRRNQRNHPYDDLFVIRRRERKIVK